MRRFVLMVVGWGVYLWLSSHIAGMSGWVSVLLSGNIISRTVGWDFSGAYG